MPVLSRRSKLVSFRISEEEYIELTQLCRDHRARSLSDLVRDTMRQVIADQSHRAAPLPDSSTDMHTLRERLLQLEDEVRRLTHISRKAAAGASSHSKEEIL